VDVVTDEYYEMTGGDEHMNTVSESQLKKLGYSDDEIYRAMWDGLKIVRQNELGAFRDKIHDNERLAANAEIRSTTPVYREVKLRDNDGRIITLAVPHGQIVQKKDISMYDPRVETSRDGPVNVIYMDAPEEAIQIDLGERGGSGYSTARRVATVAGEVIIVGGAVLAGGAVLGACAELDFNLDNIPMVPDQTIAPDQIINQIPVEPMEIFNQIPVESQIPVEPLHIILPHYQVGGINITPDYDMLPGNASGTGTIVVDLDSPGYKKFKEALDMYFPDLLSGDNSSVLPGNSSTLPADNTSIIPDNGSLAEVPEDTGFEFGAKARIGYIEVRGINDSRQRYDLWTLDGGLAWEDDNGSLIKIDFRGKWDFKDYVKTMAILDDIGEIVGTNPVTHQPEVVGMSYTQGAEVFEKTYNEHSVEAAATDVWEYFPHVGVEANRTFRRETTRTAKNSVEDNYDGTKDRTSHSTYHREQTTSTDEMGIVVEFDFGDLTDGDGTVHVRPVVSATRRTTNYNDSKVSGTGTAMPNNSRDTTDVMHYTAGASVDVSGDLGTVIFGLEQQWTVGVDQSDGHKTFCYDAKTKQWYPKGDHESEQTRFVAAYSNGHWTISTVARRGDRNDKHQRKDAAGASFTYHWSNAPKNAAHRAYHNMRGLDAEDARGGRMFPDGTFEIVDGITVFGYTTKNSDGKSLFGVSAGKEVAENVTVGGSVFRYTEGRGQDDFLNSVLGGGDRYRGWGIGGGVSVGF
jgi:hypothetical protein